MRDPWALELTAPRPGAIAAAIVKLVVAAPLAAIGAVMGWIPYRLAGWVAARVTHDEDILGTVKLFAGTLFLLVGWTAEAIAVGCAWARAGRRRCSRWVSPAATWRCGSRSCCVTRPSGGGAVCVARLSLQDARRLAERRRALADEVARALADGLPRERRRRGPLRPRGPRTRG